MAKAKDIAIALGTYALMSLLSPLLLFLAILYEETGDPAVDSYRYPDI